MENQDVTHSPEAENSDAAAPEVVDSAETIDTTPDTLKIESDIQEVSACERHIKVTITREEVDRYFAKEFDELAESAYVPGFRSGKAPRTLVERRFRKEVAERVKSALLLDALEEINDDKTLTPISEPDIDFGAVFLPEEGPFVFEFNLEVRPEFELPEWKGITLEKPVREFGAEDIDRAIERILVSYGRMEKKDGPAEIDDYLVTRLTFSRDGEKLSTTDEETIRIRPTLSFHDGTIKDFDKLMVGVSAGETRATEMVISEDAANPELRGLSVSIAFEVIEVNGMVLPELNKEFLDQLGGFDNIGDFRDAVLDILKRQLEHEQNQRARRQITEKLTVAANWELPPAMLRRQSERELRRIIMELQRSGYPDDVIQSQLNVIRQNSSASTAQALKEHFILEKIAEMENIEETQRDYDMEIALIAAQSGMTPRRVRAQLEKQGEMDILRNQVIERKVLALIMENAKFVEVPFEFDEPEDEAIDLAASGPDAEIAEVDPEDLKAARREEVEKKMIDPNAKTS